MKAGLFSTKVNVNMQPTIFLSFIIHDLCFITATSYGPELRLRNLKSLTLTRKSSVIGIELTVH